MDVNKVMVVFQHNMVINDYYGIPQGTEHQFWKQVDRQNHYYVTQQELMDYIYIRHKYLFYY